MALVTALGGAWFWLWNKPSANDLQTGSQTVQQNDQMTPQPSDAAPLNEGLILVTCNKQQG